MAADRSPAPHSGSRTTPEEDPLSQLTALGPYFAVEIHPPSSPVHPPWRPLGDLTGNPNPPTSDPRPPTGDPRPATGDLNPPTGDPRPATGDPNPATGDPGPLTGDPGRLTDRIDEVRERLAAAAGRAPSEVDFRVAASVAHLGLCARLLSPVLGAAAAGWALPVDTGQARWVPALGGPFRLSLPESSLPGPALPQRSLPGPASRGGVPGDGAPGDGTAACLDVLAGPVAQVTRAVEAMAVSPQVLWGNVASAVSGAAAMIAKARPDLAAPAAAAATAMLCHPALTGTYQGSPGAGFRRRNCCLIYRLTPPGAASYCGDCVLGPA